jgi:integrase
MENKKQKTECSGMEWGIFLTLLDRLKKDREYKFLLFIAVGCYCGLRAGDILRLRWKDLVNMDQINLNERKTGKCRQITINQNLKEIVSFCFSNLSDVNADNVALDQHIFSNRIGKPITIQYVNRKLHTIFHRYRIKVQNPSSHTLRKSFGKKVYEMNDKSPEALVLLSQIFSHSSVATTRRYIGLSQEIIQNVYTSL